MENTQVKAFSLEFLRKKENLTAVIATSTKDGKPHAAVIYYYVDDAFNFYFLTAHNTRKYKTLIQNPHISFTIGFGFQYITIQGWGTAHILEKNSDVENEIILNINNRLHANDYHWPIFQIPRYEKEELCVFKIVPNELRLLNLDQENYVVTFKNDFQNII